MDLGLKGKIAVVTGGSIGIGLAIAEALAEEGAHLVLGPRDEARPRAAPGRIGGRAAREGVKAVAVPADVSRAGDIERVVGAVDEAFGAADILVNNAGTGSNEKIMEATDEKWQRYWDLHVMAAVRLARGLVPLMRDRG